MRYAETLRRAVLLSVLSVTFGGAEVGWADTPEKVAEEPNLFQKAVTALSTGEAGDSTWSGMERRPALPQAENDGSIKGATLSERMNSMRRRAAETDISRPFQAEDAGMLPAVARRPLAGAAAPPQAVPTPLPPVAEPQLEPLAAADAVANMQPEFSPVEEAPIDEPREAEVPMTRIATHPLDAVPPAQPAFRQQRSIDFATAANAAPIPSTIEDVDEGRVLLSNAAPSLTFETAGPRSIVLGREATYQVTMINRGNADAKNVLCNVRLPQWAEVVSQAASVGAANLEKGDDSDQKVRWEISNLNAGKRETLTLRIVPRDSRPFDLAVGWTFRPDHASAQIEVKEPKLEIQLNGSEEIDYAATDVYTITISNPGTGDAENVVLNLMPMTTNQQAAGSKTLGTIAPGERKSLELELTAHQAGRLQVRAMAYADNGLRAEATHEVLVRRANLEVVIMGPPRNFAATSANYKVRVENTGNAVAEATKAIASLPAGARFVASTDGGRIDEQRGQVEWSMGALRPGAVRMLELECELTAAGENRFDIQCNSTHDISVSKSLITMVEASADLKLFVNDPQGAIPVGEDAEYEIRVVNRGTKAAKDVEVVGYFSHGIEPEAILRGGRGELLTGQVLFDRIGIIAPGQEKVFRVLARAHTPGNHVFRAELQCDRPETRLASEEWTKYFGNNETPRQAQATSPATRR